MSRSAAKKKFETILFETNSSETNSPETTLKNDEDHPLISYSAVTGEGKRELWSLINQRIAQASRQPTAHPTGESLETE